MGRPITAAPVAASSGIRDALIANLAHHVRRTQDPRFDLIPRDQWPDPLPLYRDPTADLLDDLRAGRAVDVGRWRVSRLAEIPQGVHHVRVAPDGTLSPTFL